MRHRGFTLIEFVVTVTILALLILAVAPSMSTWLRNTRIRSVAEVLQNGLQQARNEAVRRNQNVSFWLVSLSAPGTLDNGCVLSSSSGSWVVSVSSPESACAVAPSTNTAPMIVAANAVGDTGFGVSVAAAQIDGAAATNVTFNGFGHVVAGASTIAKIDVNNMVPGDDFRPLRIEVASAGSVRMCEPLVASASDPRRCKP